MPTGDPRGGVSSLSWDVESVSELPVLCATLAATRSHTYARHPLRTLRRPLSPSADLSDGPQVEADRLLHAGRCQNGPGISFEDIARLFMPLGVEPDGLLWLLETGTHVGEAHQRYAGHLERCRVLAASSDGAYLGQRVARRAQF